MLMVVLSQVQITPPEVLKSGPTRSFGTEIHLAADVRSSEANRMPEGPDAWETPHPNGSLDLVHDI